MLHPQRIDCLVLDLPRHNAAGLLVAIDDARNKLGRGIEKWPVVRRADERVFRQRLHDVRRGKELGVAERLQRADADDDLLPCALGSLHLPIELTWIERARARLNATPVRTY